MPMMETINDRDRATKTPGLGYRFLRTPWTVVTKARKDTTCWLCDGPIVKGDSSCKPLLETPFRMKRIHVECMEARCDG
jgi:hypothetical protein